MYIFYPAGGMGNRMRVIDSAYRFCNKRKKKFKIIWWKYSGVDCAFNRVFEPIDKLVESNFNLFNFLEKWKRKLLLFRYFLLLLEKLHILRVLSHTESEKLIKWINDEEENTTGYLFFIISSYSSFYLSETDKFQSDLFILNPELKTLTDKETDKFTENTIGVHIRRTDNKESIDKSPLELFIKRMEQEIMKEPKTNFYVASDSNDVKIKLKEKFGNNVILPIGILNNNSEEGIVQGVVELFALAKTNKIFGSYYSSFSEIAAMLRGVEITTIKTE